MLTEMVKEVLLLEGRKQDKEKVAKDIVMKHFNGKVDESTAKNIVSSITDTFFNGTITTNENTPNEKEIMFADTSIINILPFITKLLLPGIQKSNAIDDPIKFFSSIKPITYKLHFIIRQLYKTAIVNNDPKFISKFINDFQNSTLEQFLVDALEKFSIKYDDNDIDNKQHTYTVVGPLTFEQAKKYGLNSCTNSKICYTQGDNSWNRYLDGGKNDLYIFLRDDWKDIPEIHTECKIFPDHPEWNGYDDYGLSMLFVIVTPGLGGLKYCNTRWNHNGDYKPEFRGDVNHVLTVDELRQIVGAELFNEVIQIDEYLQQFSYVESIGNGLYKIETENGYNIYDKNTKRLLLVNADNQPVWFNWIKVEKDCDWLWVEKYDDRGVRKCNYLKPDTVNGGYQGLFGDINNANEWWFNYIVKDDNSDWFMVTKIFDRDNVKYNYLKPNGKGKGGYELLFGKINDPNTWFDYIEEGKYCDWFSVEKKDGRGNVIYNYIDINGNLLLDKWVSWREIDSINPEEYSQQKLQQNQPLNEIINRLVRNYRRY